MEADPNPFPQMELFNPVGYIKDLGRTVINKVTGQRETNDRLVVLNDVEHLVWNMVEKGRMTAVEAEEAIYDCAMWAEEN